MMVLSWFMPEAFIKGHTMLATGLSQALGYAFEFFVVWALLTFRMPKALVALRQSSCAPRCASL